MTANVLLLTHRTPFPPNKGDRIRTYHCLRFLADRANVYLACLADEPVSTAADTVLHDLCQDVAVVPTGGCSRWCRALASFGRGRTLTEGALRRPAMARVLQNWSRRRAFDAVLLSSSGLAPYLSTPGLECPRAVVDLVDVDSEKWLEYSRRTSGPRSWAFATEGVRLRRTESALGARATALTVVSPAEAAVYRRFAPLDRLHVVPNGVDLDYFQPETAVTGLDCLFVGALDYLPNVDGVCWFARHIWPAIHQLRPRATLTLVGRRPTASIRRLARLPGIRMIGEVADVRPYLHRCAVSIAPLRIARGIQNKILEALACGKSVVASPACLPGLGAVPGKHLLAPPTVRHWVATIVALLDDPALRDRLGKAARAYVEQNHRWHACLEPFGVLLGC